MKEEIEKYTKLLMEETFGFTPSINIEETGMNYFKVELNGNESQRRQIMGAQGMTFQALKRLYLIYAKRKNVFILFGIKRLEENIAPYGGY